VTVTLEPGRYDAAWFSAFTGEWVPLPPVEGTAVEIPAGSRMAGLGAAAAKAEVSDQQAVAGIAAAILSSGFVFLTETPPAWKSQRRRLGSPDR
jgi:hypothetical protein